MHRSMIINKTRQFSSKYLEIILQWRAANDNAMSAGYLEQTFSSLSAWVLYKMPLKLRTF